MRDARVWIAIALIAAAGAPATAERPSRQPAKETIAGFRMEGDPTFDTVFADVTAYKGYIDRFFLLDGEMRQTRAEFGRYVRRALAGLSGTRGRCPVDAVAPLYARAFDAGKRYRELGAELEARYEQIRKLDELGETAGLTPDYRWKVNRVRGAYDAAIADYREMRGVFEDQLETELKFRSCKLEDLRALGGKVELPAEPETTPAVNRPPRRRRTKQPVTQPPLTAQAVFVVDNAACPRELAVFVDGAKLGVVAAHAKSAFQTPVGRHAVCLIDSASDAVCGDPGTIRNTYVHNGWSIALKCD